MKRLFLSTLIAFCATAMHAQNIQMHYDFGRNLYSDEENGRQKVTLTLEQFKADNWGSWFYFVDIDLSRHFTEGAYTEIAREFRIDGKSPFAAHLEYNGGLNRHGSFQQAALIGPAYNGHNSDFSNTYAIQLMYKRFFKSYDNTRAYNSAQLTGVWSLSFANKAVTFSGFMDFWRGEKANHHGQLVFLTEPQLWYNITPHFSVGTEWEISNNFIFNTYNDKSFFVNPTIGMKWKM